MGYLPFKDFAVKYVIDPQLDLIFQDDYVVKVIHSFPEALREINVLSHFPSHPCIISMKNWSWNDAIFYLVLEKGIPLTETTKLSEKQVAQDVLSGLKALYSIGVCHNDLKLENLVYCNGHVKLIDFGATSSILNFRNRTVIREYRYTPTHRDPQFLAEFASDVKGELYALGATLANYFHHVNLVESYPLSVREFSFSELINDLIEYPVQKRLDLDEIIEKYSLEITTQSAVPFSKDRETDGNIKRLALWGIKLLPESTDVDTLFLMIHLAHHLSCDNIKLLTIALLFISTVMTDQKLFNFSELSEMSDDDFTNNEIKTAIVDIVVELGGLLSVDTIWNYSKNGDELIGAFSDIISSSYDPVKVRPCESSLTKYLNIQDLSRLLSGAKVRGNHEIRAFKEVIDTQADVFLDPDIVIETILGRLQDLTINGTEGFELALALAPSWKYKELPVELNENFIRMINELKNVEVGRQIAEKIQSLL
jgi:serine/threonine protein kinase